MGMGMQIISSCTQAQKSCLEVRGSGRKLALVPTMGFLHAGHESLMHWARKHSDLLVVSLFVNPAQFGPGEDLARYPRDLERDVQKAGKAGVDILFYATWVEVEGLSSALCGRFRPGHFRGVATIVCKMFNLLCPHLAVFGQKDWQQLVIIRRMARDLNIPVQVVGRPTLREQDGLAMSSRNAYLSPEERKAASHVFQGLKQIREEFLAGKTGREELENLLREYYRENLPLAAVEYVRIVDAQTLEPTDPVRPGSLAVAALKLGKARLIDNILLQEGVIS